MGKYFGTDGVRGIANKELTPELAFKLGRCGGYVLSRHEDEKEQPKVLVGRDTRMSGQLLESALIAGLLSVGIEVFQLGVISTPGVAYLTRVQKASSGVMISASHNPAADNGIKFFGNDGFKLADEKELEIEALLDSEEDDLPRPSADGLGSLEEFPEGMLKYSQYLQQTIKDDLSGLTVCIDAANGATAPTVNRLFADLETDFYTIGTSPNGVNINDGVGSTHPEQLADFVVEKQADVGIAFDGDGDRVIAVDENGQIVDGDKIMYICANYLAENDLLKQNTIVTTVMSNLGFHKAVEAAGLNDVVTKVGDRYVVEEMRKNDYNFGGEQSGHMVFFDLNTTGDGMLSGIQLLNIIKQTGKKLSELAANVTIYPQKLVNIRVSDKYGAMEVPAIKKIIDDVEAKLGDEGRILVRASGTEPLLRIMAEAPTDEEVDYYVNQIADVVRNEIGLDE
ncbi:phosphoglucosamine mutase [Tetragenococcus halophilus]|uniref:Phosphoglucosamine mutase n=1 Tax=Tetragenococcus halophilus (strain DSM 20338 / JCM 20259 / NCIMB 9735 / NBRC 12172) TaxID=945021 RepID=A0AAN1VR23_TETHN|nr:phosphoglucosamine mutase [Tetragenococcus halophilus]NWN99539.1 phosphoglucosamine mutase [Tetragenococcus halophilus]RQD32696.1 phosphoglucosamine mutase [Tetragenococcus halophilus subsp. halophilus DSM 20339]WJS81005.1 phosphoglucosamine mutase [Tetragenococcus halophilus]BAK94639.1 phosphoglucosamine mutase [Tetragenococcus halophilus NBRC 12172]GBD58980.1 phosphoglucosamine mutase [Tetragenococcus halophilus subsp. halophilus]